MTSDWETINSDILVVDRGMAACRVALRAREPGAGVALVDKAHVSQYVPVILSEVEESLFI